MDSAALFIAYFLGSIPTAYILGRLLGGIDIRRHGSGNIGAANMREALGWKSGLAVLAIDAIKGALAVLIASWCGASLWMAATLAVAGHIYPVWLKFEGGKGLATGAGTIATVACINAPVLFSLLFAFAIIWILFYAYDRDLDHAALAGALAAALVALVLEPGRGLFFVLLLIIAKHAHVLATGRHRSNA